MTPLTAHFSLEEVTHSEVAARLGIPNEPDAETIANLRALCVDVLEPLRNTLGRPLFVSSGYRSPTLNRSVNGSSKSDHMLGLAADIVAPPIPLEHIVEAVRQLAPFFPLKQCILEFGRWIHVSRLPLDGPLAAHYSPEFLIASLNERGGTVYRVNEV
jgi:hypothetical protein